MWPWHARVGGQNISDNDADTSTVSQHPREAKRPYAMQQPTRAYQMMSEINELYISHLAIIVFGTSNRNDRVESDNSPKLHGEHPLF